MENEKALIRLEDRKKTFFIAQKILNGYIDIVEGIREIQYYIGAVESWGNYFSDSFRSYYTDVSYIPRGKQRLQYTAEELKERDFWGDQCIANLTPYLLEDCKRLINEYKHEKLFPEEKAKLKIRKLALEIMDGEIESHGTLGEILSLWPQTDLEENDFYFYILGVYESGEPTAESFKSTMQDLINYCDEMLIFPADSFD